MNIRKFFGLCEHFWVIIGKGEIIDEDDDKVGTYYHLQCDKCGMIKRKEI